MEGESRNAAGGAKQKGVRIAGDGFDRRQQRKQRRTRSPFFLQEETEETERNPDFSSAFTAAPVER
jgi:hypothetical protein